MYARVFYFVFFCFVMMKIVHFALRLAGRKSQGNAPTGGAASGIIEACAVFLPAALLMATPIEGLTVAEYLAGFNSNWSIPSLLVFLDSLYASLSGRRPLLLDNRTRRPLWIFGSLAALVLYPASLGLFNIDTYEYGFGSLLLVAPLAAVTLGLLLAGNRLSVVLLACVLAWNVGLQESRNLWDYLIDPFFSVLSIFAALRAIIGSISIRFKPATDLSG